MAPKPAMMAVLSQAVVSAEAARAQGAEASTDLLLSKFADAHKGSIALQFGSDGSLVFSPNCGAEYGIR